MEDQYVPTSVERMTVMVRIYQRAKTMRRRLGIVLILALFFPRLPTFTSIVSEDTTGETSFEVAIPIHGAFGPARFIEERFALIF